MIRGKVRYKWNHWFLRKVYRWPSAMTLGHTILFKYPEAHYAGTKTVAHELVHVQQIERMGLLKFYAKYLWLLMRHGYKNHPYEIEAREKAEEVTA